MRKLILQEFVTVNGLAAGPGDSTDFVSAAVAGDKSFGRRQLAFIDSIDTMLLGRVTYEMFSQYWPKVTSGEDAPFAEKLNRLEKTTFIFSTHDAKVMGHAHRVVHLADGRLDGARP